MLINHRNFNKRTHLKFIREARVILISHSVILSSELKVRKAKIGRPSNASVFWSYTKVSKR